MWGCIVPIWVAFISCSLVKQATYQRQRICHLPQRGRAISVLGRLVFLVRGAPRIAAHQAPLASWLSMPVAPTSHSSSQKCHHAFPDASGCLWTAWARWTCLPKSQGRKETFLSVSFSLYVVCICLYLSTSVSIYISIICLLFLLFLFVFFHCSARNRQKESLLRKNNKKQINNPREGQGRQRKREKGSSIAAGNQGEVSVPHSSVASCAFLFEATNKISGKDTHA